MRRNDLIKKIDNRIYFKIFVAMLWSESILLEYIRGAMLNLPIVSMLANYIVPCSMFIVFMMGYKTFTERLRGQDFVFVMTCLVVYVFEFWLYKRNRDYFRISYTEFIIGSLPFYFVGVALRGDDGEILDWLYKISCVTVVAFALYMSFINQMNSNILRGGDMSSSYNILPHACLTFYYMMKKFNWRRLAIFLLAAVFLLMMGTRGSIVCLLLFVLVVTAITIRFQKPILLLVVAAICVLLISFRGITDFLIDIAYDVGEKFGLSTRVFDKFLSGDFTSSTGRTVIREKIEYYLREYPIVGLGIYGDIFVTKGQYAHNFFLEVYAHFGYLIGTILTVAFSIYVIRSVIYVFKIKDENAQLVTLLLLSCCFKLVVSGSYLREPFFWLMLGYFVSLLRERRYRMETELDQEVTTSKYIK